MKMTAKTLTARENAIFDALERRSGDATFRKRLYRDGVPTPQAYLAQRVRVLFVFREPNMREAPYALDMRDEVSDEGFRPIGRDGRRQNRSAMSWWNGKPECSHTRSLRRSTPRPKATRSIDLVEAGGNEVVNRYAYIQVKKVGGGERQTRRRSALTPSNTPLP